MDDFSAKPGVPNVYGLVGGDANAVGPNKRPLSSMSPTIVVKDGKTWLVTGSPGGSRIITTVLQMVVNSIDYGMNVAEATNAPRFHHQWLPDELRVEKGFSPDTLKLLEAKGQKVALKEAMGSTQSIMVGPDGELYGASDPRSVDDLTAGVLRLAALFVGRGLFCQGKPKVAFLFRNPVDILPAALPFPENEFHHCLYQ